MSGLDAHIHVTRDAFRVDASLAITEGRTAALLGPNGSGKSTIVAALAGLIPLDAGHIELHGEVLEDVARDVRLPARRRSAGVVFQDSLLFPHMTALENVAFGCRARGTSRAEARARAGELIERFGIAHVATRMPASLSGGEAARVALARALAPEPRMLLLDEPLAALDVAARAEIVPLLRGILAGFPGVRVLVTHDPVEAMTLAGDLVLIEAGRITQRGTPEEIRAAPRTSYAAALVGVNLYRGRLVPVEDGLARLETATGDVYVAVPPGTPARDGALALVRPADVVISRARLDTSARNVLHGEVVSVAIDGGRARVRIASNPPVVAEITPGSVARLELREGACVWVSFKAVEVELLP